MEEKILEILKVSRNNGLSKQEVYKKLAYTNLSFEDFEEVFDDLQTRQEIYQTGKDKYTLNPFKEAEIQITRKGLILAKTDKDTYEISEDQFNCLTGDKVKIRITDFNQKKGTIKEVLDRKGTPAEVKIENGKKYAIVRNKENETKYELKTDENLVDGILIGIKLEKNRKDKQPVATLDRIFGHKNKPRLDEEIILYENNFNYEWPEEVKKEIKYIPSEVSEEEKKGRRDLRNIEIFTIDGDDTKDIDDAISLDKLENGNYLLGVHIADVANYVKEGTAIDKESYERATSVYMNTVVNPMYPVELSNGICSLNPETDRLAMTAEMEINPKGKVVNYDIFESVIHSRKQMTYKNVNKILKSEEVPEGYEPFQNKLKEMYELSKILKKNRQTRGYQEFQTSEIKVETDENGIPTEIGKREDGPGQKLIEMFMLAANETVATHIYNMGIPSIYRDHDKPNEEKLKKVTEIIKNYGETFKTKGKVLSPKYLSSLLEELKETQKYETYCNMILRSLAKATYESYNIGHFSVGINSDKREAYTHFTSPIRRYPDTTVHRVLKMIFQMQTEKLYSKEHKEKMAAIAKHSSIQEQNADKCERESNKMKTAEYMENILKENQNEIYEGIISGFAATGMYVQLPNLIEGRVGYNTMDDFYHYDDEQEIIIGEKTGKIYRLGDKVTVKLTKASKMLREIDFEIEQKSKNQTTKTRQRKMS